MILYGGVRYNVFDGGFHSMWNVEASGEVISIFSGGSIGTVDMNNRTVIS